MNSGEIITTSAELYGILYTADGYMFECLCEFNIFVLLYGILRFKICSKTDMQPLCPGSTKRMFQNELKL